MHASMQQMHFAMKLLHASRMGKNECLEIQASGKVLANVIKYEISKLRQ